MKTSKLLIIFALLLAFDICVSAQSKSFPNELKDYEFFGNGKLKDLKLGSSEKKDVETIFGEYCEKYCDYDENFKIKFEYLTALDDCMTTEDIRDRIMCPQSDFVGTVSSITLEPKQYQILKDLPTSKFNMFSGGSSIEKGSGVSNSYTSFTDKYGLRYSINNELSGKVVLHSQYPPFVQGKLHSIKYIFTGDTIRKIFTVDYMIRKKELNK
jgi:hypothetical protein